MESQTITSLEFLAHDSILARPRIFKKTKFFPNFEKEESLVTTSSSILSMPIVMDKRSSSNYKDPALKINRWIALKHGIKAAKKIRYISCTIIESPVIQ